MTRYIMGKNCLEEVLKHAPKTVIEVYTSQKQDDPLYQLIEEAGIKLISKGKQALSKIVDSESHQSFVAKVQSKHFVSVPDFLKQKKEKSVVLMLDSIYDPQNFGSILRAAECFGVDLVIYSKNRGVDLTPVVSKASVGASELVPLARVSNLAETMKTFQNNDYWAYAADVGEHTENIHTFNFPEKTLLIMGSEGKGIQPLLSKKCDGHLTIPMKGHIDSLNVSQATAVFLSRLK